VYVCVREREREREKAREREIEEKREEKREIPNYAGPSVPLLMCVCACV